MNIAFFHELPYGGARRVSGEYGKRLKKSNKVDLYYVDESNDKEIKQSFNNTFYYKFTPKIWQGKNWRVKSYKDSIELIKLSALHKKIAKKIDSKNYDFVIIHPSKFTQAPFILKYLKTIKVYYCQETLRMVYEKKFGISKDLFFIKKNYEKINRTIRKKIDKENILKADHILSNSYFTKNNIKKAYGIDSIVCYLGVDEKKFHPIKLIKEYDLLFIGGNSINKGADLLGKIIKQLDKKIKVKVLGLNDEYISDSELVNNYNKAKILLALGRNEPFGLTILEAMSCGLPVLAVDEGGYRETIIDGKTGFLVPRNPLAIAEKVKWLLDNPSKTNQIGNYGRNIAIGRWAWSKRIREFERIINKFIKK